VSKVKGFIFDGVLDFWLDIVHGIFIVGNKLFNLGLVG